MVVPMIGIKQIFYQSLYVSLDLTNCYSCTFLANALQFVNNEYVVLVMCHCTSGNISTL